MNKSIKRGVAIALLLFTFTVPATTFVMTNEGQIEVKTNQSMNHKRKNLKKC